MQTCKTSQEGIAVSDKNKEKLIQQLKLSQPQIEEIITNHIPAQNAKSITHLVEWLRANNMPPMFQEMEHPVLIWTVEANGNSHHILWGGNDYLSIMIGSSLTPQYQEIIRAKNMQDIVLNNLQQCSRADGGHCDGCHLPPDVAGVTDVVLGREVKNLCCGMYITFDNPSAEAVECIKILLGL